MSEFIDVGAGLSYDDLTCGFTVDAKLTVQSVEGPGYVSAESPSTAVKSLQAGDTIKFFPNGKNFRVIQVVRGNMGTMKKRRVTHVTLMQEDSHSLTRLTLGYPEDEVVQVQ